MHSLPTALPFTLHTVKFLQSKQWETKFMSLFSSFSSYKVQIRTALQTHAVSHPHAVAHDLTHLCLNQDALLGLLQTTSAARSRSPPRNGEGLDHRAVAHELQVPLETQLEENRKSFEQLLAKQAEDLEDVTPRDLASEIDSVPSSPLRYGGLSDIYPGVWHSPHGDIKASMSQ